MGLRWISRNGTPGDDDRERQILALTSKLTETQARLEQVELQLAQALKDSSEKAPSRVERWIDKPVARATAIIGLVLALVAAVGLWPDHFWPRSVPVVDISVQARANWGTIYSTSREPDSLSGAPSHDAPGGCFGEPRHNWAQVDLGGFPVADVEAYVDLTARRRETSAVVVDFKPVILRKTDGFRTTVIPCIKYFQTGGANYYERNIFVDFSPSGTRTTFRDEKGDEVERLAVSLTKGDAASFVVRPGVSDESGVGYEWYADLVVFVNGEYETVRVPETGSFRIASGNDAESAAYWSDESSPIVCRPLEAPGQWCS